MGIIMIITISETASQMSWTMSIPTSNGKY